MYERVMTLREEPLVIATLHGPIEIHRVQGVPDESGRRPERKLRIVLPTGLSVTVGMERALSRNSWIERVDQEIVPRHQHYVAAPDNDGGVQLTHKEPSTPPQDRPVIRVVRRTGT